MTVEIVYGQVRDGTIQWTQLDMAKQIAKNRGFPIEDIERVYGQNRLVVRVETSLPDSAVDNMLSDIEDHLNPEAEHVETREV